jgi:hypothetical protein
MGSVRGQRLGKSAQLAKRGNQRGPLQRPLNVQESGAASLLVIFATNDSSSSVAARPLGDEAGDEVGSRVRPKSESDGSYQCGVARFVRCQLPESGVNNG